MRRAVWCIACAGLLAGCGEERRSYVANAGTDTPTMTTTDVNTFISDSGYVRYHIDTRVWEMYEEAKDPYWRFPEELRLEQYDHSMQREANIRSDSAVYMSRRRLWRLDGHVVMVNVDGDSFLTQQLFWDQQQRKVYSDSFIHIVRSDRVIEGYGFRSNENMTEYTVNRPTGIIPIDRDARGAGAAPDSTAADSTAAPAKSRRAAPKRASERDAERIAPTPAQASPSTLTPAVPSPGGNNSTTIRPMK
ncbi:MAG: LPS export ABC transporter periplasmic protein LptC [Muribaculaceae bacterium]|nr:LPS export ABC transporter periplasmic protein LptC [Muribaculaceae bacterium]